jgi:hypothetical protein
MLAVTAPVDWVPVNGLAPDQPPEAVHAVALLLDHVNVEVPPLATVLGFAAMVTVGPDFDTVTVTDWAPVPPAPVQVKV